MLARRTLGWALAGLLLLSGVAVAGEEKPLWLAVGRSELVPGLAPLVAHRRAEGFEVRVVTTSVAEALASAPRRPSFLLLVGDDVEGEGARPWRVPSPRRPLYRWRAVQRPTFAADPALADLDRDGMPDVPVGRLPVRTPEHVRRIVAKILAYERREPTEEDLRLVVWGGAPGYGPRLDATATGLLLMTVRRHAPPWVSPWMISAAAGQDLCGWPPDQPGLFLDRMARGGCLAAVLAHADETSVLAMRHASGRILLTAVTATERLAGDDPAPPLVLLACSAGSFTRAEPCLAESLLLLPGGPVATIAATTESHPLTNYLTGVEMLRALHLERGHRRLGDLWHDARRRAHEARDPLMEMMLRDAEGKLEPEIDVAKLRHDQVLMYALLGDPATRLRIPRPLEVAVERTPAGWRWSVARPEGATRLTVGLRPFRWPSAVAARKPVERDAARERFAAANAILGFEPLAAPGRAEPWRGVIAGPGRLRFLVTGPGVFRVGVVDLR